MSQVQRHMVTFSWRGLVLIVLLVSLSDDSGLLALGNSGYTSPGYTILRHLAPFGTMRSYGFVLLLMLAGALIAFGQYVTSGRAWMLTVWLALLGGWQVMWLCTIVSSWVITHHTTGWPAITKVLFYAGTCFWCAKHGPPGSRRKAV